MSDPDDRQPVADPKTPVDTNGNPILHDDNDASLPGLLLRLGKFYEKTGFFKTYFANRTVLLSNGRTAVESVDCIPFLEGTHTDHRDFANRCPDTASRVTKYNAAATIRAALTSTTARTITNRFLPKVPA